MYAHKCVKWAANKGGWKYPRNGECHLIYPIFSGRNPVLLFEWRNDVFLSQRQIWKVARICLDLINCCQSFFFCRNGITRYQISVKSDFDIVVSRAFFYSWTNSTHAFSFSSTPSIFQCTDTEWYTLFSLLFPRKKKWQRMFHLIGFLLRSEIFIFCPSPICAYQTENE